MAAFGGYVLAFGDRPPNTIKINNQTINNPILWLCGSFRFVKIARSGSAPWKQSILVEQFRYRGRT